MEFSPNPPGKREIGWYWAIWNNSVYMVEVTPELQPEDGCVVMHGMSDFGHAKYEFTGWMKIEKPELPK